MSFSAYPIYKNSGDEWLSEVPEHWEVLPLKHFAEVDNSGCYGVEPADGDHIRPVATTAQIDSEGRFDVGRMSDRGFSAQELARYECSPGDVLVVKSSGSAENIISGKAGLVREDTPAFVFSNFLMRLRYRKDFCLPSFLYSLLISHLTRERIKQMCSTTTYPNLQVGLYTSAKLPCPPLSEQTQIARFLDHETARLDALIEEQQRLIELLKEKRQAVISHAVTKGLDPTAPMKDSGVEWLGEVPAHWDVCSVRRVISAIEQGWSPECEANPADEDSWGVLKAGCVNRGVFDPSENKTLPAWLEPIAEYEVRAGDILMSRASGSPELVGSTALLAEVREKLMLSDKIFRIHLETKISSSFFVWVMNAQFMRAQIEQALSGGNGLANNLPQSSLLAFWLAVPPSHEQVAIAEYINKLIGDIDALISEGGYAVELLQERRSALISAAVTGKIDVRGWQPTASIQAPEPAVAEAN